MSIDDCYYLGYIVKPHGFKGAFQASLDVSYPEEYIELESVFVELDGQLVPFFISNITIQNKGKARIEIEDVRSTEEAKRLVGKQLFLPLSNLPELSGDHFYYHEIPDFQLIDESDKEIGKIVKIQEAPAQDLIVVMHQEKEVLIPILEDTIIKLDKENKQLKIKLLPGLLELYLNT